MTAQEFDFLWKRLFPKSLPLPHLLRQDYRSDWFRIRSLDGARRYPSTEKDIASLLARENAIITEVLGQRSKVLGITGEYNFEKEKVRSTYLRSKLLRRFTFTELNPIDMHELSRSEFKAGDIYRLYLAELVWEEGAFDELLEAIAFDEARMFFLNPEKKTVAAPFDGGVDFIVPEPGASAGLKLKYKDWLAKTLEIRV